MSSYPQIILFLIVILFNTIGTNSEEVKSTSGIFEEKIKSKIGVRFVDTEEILQRPKRVPQFFPSFQQQQVAVQPVVPVVERQVPVVPVVEQHIHHHHIDHVVTHEEDAPEIDLWDVRDSIPGTPNEDYPVLRTIPKTQFSCRGRIPGYYADPDTNCQVFHRCSEHEEGSRKRMDSFLCLNGTTFNQEILSCDWWENVRCENAQRYYNLNKELNMRDDSGKYVELTAHRDNSEEKYVSPGIIPKNERRPLPPQFRSPLNKIQATEKPYTAADIQEDETIIQSEGEIDANELAEEVKKQPLRPSSTAAPLPPDVDEDEVAFFFTPEQLNAIRTSRGFGEKLNKGNAVIPTSAPVTTFHPPMRKYMENINTQTQAPDTVLNNTNLNSESTTTYRYPLYGKSEAVSPNGLPLNPKPKQKNNERYEDDNLFDEKLKETKMEQKQVNKTMDVEIPLDESEEVEQVPKSNLSNDKTTTTTTTTPEPPLQIQTRKFKPKQRLRKISARKIDEDRDEPKPRTRTPSRSKTQMDHGLPFPREQIVVYPDGTRKLLKHKHLLHSDIEEIHPTYISHVRQPIQLQPVLAQPQQQQFYNPYLINPYAQTQQHTQNLVQQIPNQQNQISYFQPQFSQPQQSNQGQIQYNQQQQQQPQLVRRDVQPNQLQQLLQPGQAQFSRPIFQNAQSNIATTQQIQSQQNIFPLTQSFPHQPPPFMINELGFQTAPPVATHEHHHHHVHGTYHKALEPHHIIPAFYHQNNNQKSISNTNKDALIHPHHTLTELQDTVHHHNHARIPQNPFSAEHYAGESHLAVAAFHQLHQPNPVFLQHNGLAANTGPIIQLTDAQKDTLQSGSTPLIQVQSNAVPLSQYMHVFSSL